LVDSLAQLERRLDAIQKDRRRKTASLEADSGEQAVQRENDEMLDARDAQGRQELQAIAAALGRLAAGTDGDCDGRSESIPEERLRTRPTAVTCVESAEWGSSRSDREQISTATYVGRRR
jgi:RNA polymerase-binding transcription factor DksA